jgi:hypothetical protein
MRLFIRVIETFYYLFEADKLRVVLAIIIALAIIKSSIGNVSMLNLNSRLYYDKITARSIKSFLL